MVTQERRSAGRVRAFQPVRLTRLGHQHVIESLTKDLSPNGAKCLSTTLFPLASELTLELGLGPGQGLVNVRGRVIWFQVRPESEQFDLGVQFLGMSPEDKRRLSTYLEHPARQISAS